MAAKWISVWGISVMAVMTGCSSMPPKERHAQALAEYQQFADPPVNQFPYFRLERWEVLGRDKLVVWTSVRNVYLLTVNGGCPDLEWTQTISLTSNVNQISKNFDSVIARGLKCQIRQIEPIRYDELLAARRAEKSR